MILAEARAAARSQIVRTLSKETVGLAAARGRFLAADVVAPVDLPSFDRSAVDGYALRAAGLSADATTQLRVIGLAAAGHPFRRPVGAGEAVQIFTGASMPPGTDSVVMQEICKRHEDLLVVPARSAERENCRPRGEDIRAGTVALRRGVRLRAQHVALAAALGCDTLAVFRPLRVGLLSTGDEVREPGLPLEEDQVWDANRWFLRGLIESLGCEVVDLGIMGDRIEEIEAALADVAQDVDLLVTSGGMSVGGEDHVRTAIKRRGSLDIWRLAIKPGKPVGLGDIDDCPILALPGNPVAAAVTFVAFGRSVLLHLAGGLDEPPLSIRLPAAARLRKKPGRREFLRGVVRQSGDGPSTVAAVEKQGSAMLSSLADTQGFIVLDEAAETIEPGEPVEFIPFDSVLG